jgi:hypothetical protein
MSPVVLLPVSTAYCSLSRAPPPPSVMYQPVGSAVFVVLPATFESVSKFSVAATSSVVSETLPVPVSASAVGVTDGRTCASCSAINIAAAMKARSEVRAKRLRRLRTGFGYTCGKFLSYCFAEFGRLTGGSALAEMILRCVAGELSGVAAGLAGRRSLPFPLALIEAAYASRK